MYVIMTRVKLKPDCAETCAALFEATNRDLVRDEPDWNGARMIFDPETNTVTVLATWSVPESYKRFSASPAFRSTMARFAELFAGPPEVSVNTLLVDMAP